MTTGVSVAQRVLDIQGSQIHYQEAGSGDRTAVFLHGAGGAAPNAPFIPMLGEHMRVLAPSLPGFDGSPQGERKTILDLADALAAFISETCTGPVTLIGQSFGARVALWTTLQHPDLVENLVLSSPAALISRPPGQAPQPPRTPEERKSRLYGNFEVNFTPEQQAQMDKNAGNAFSFEAPPFDELLGRLPEITIPTLILWGTDERMLGPEANAPLYQKHIPKSYVMYIYGAAHELPIVAAEKYVALINDFVERGEMFVVNQG